MRTIDRLAFSTFRRKFGCNFRLLQQYRHFSDFARCPTRVRFRGHSGSVSSERSGRLV